MHITVRSSNNHMTGIIVGGKEAGNVSDALQLNDKTCERVLVIEVEHLIYCTIAPANEYSIVAVERIVEASDPNDVIGQIGTRGGKIGKKLLRDRLGWWWYGLH